MTRHTCRSYTLKAVLFHRTLNSAVTLSSFALGHSAPFLPLSVAIQALTNTFALQDHSLEQRKLTCRSTHLGCLPQGGRDTYCRLKLIAATLSFVEGRQIVAGTKSRHIGRAPPSLSGSLTNQFLFLTAGPYSLCLFLLFSLAHSSKDTALAPNPCRPEGMPGQ